MKEKSQKIGTFWVFHCFNGSGVHTHQKITKVNKIVRQEDREPLVKKPTMLMARVLLIYIFHIFSTDYYKNSIVYHTNCLQSLIMPSPIFPKTSILILGLIQPLFFHKHSFISSRDYIPLISSDLIDT